MGESACVLDIMRVTTFVIDESDSVIQEEADENQKSMKEIMEKTMVSFDERVTKFLFVSATMTQQFREQLKVYCRDPKYFFIKSQSDSGRIPQSVNLQLVTLKRNQFRNQQ
jgi:superfamily II DNA/RNA helicase